MGALQSELGGARGDSDEDEEPDEENDDDDDDDDEQEYSDEGKIGLYYLSILSMH